VSDEIAANDRRARALVGAVAGPVGLVVLAVTSLVLGPAVGVLVGLVVGAALAGWLWSSGPGRVRRALATRPADEITDARLLNLVEGLCSGAGVPRPEVLVLPDGAPNALAFGRHPREAVLVVTTGLIDQLSRVELEGVLARELSGIKNHDTAPGTVAAAVLPWLPIPALAERVRRASARTPALVADANGVALTRYPPGLAGGLAKLQVVTAAPAVVTPLWVHQGGPSELHPPLHERIEALREL
jgi:heat shock protein HtpX